MNDRKIAWTSYHVDNMELTDKQKMLKNMDPDDMDDEDREIYEEIESMPVVMDTPIGAVFRDDSLNPFRQIEHRICHTNFTIGERELTRTNFINGVETLTIVSRYQMIIGFGRMFDAEKVRLDIADKLVNIDTYSNEEFETHLAILKARC